MTPKLKFPPKGIHRGWCTDDGYRGKVHYDGCRVTTRWKAPAGTCTVCGACRASVHSTQDWNKVTCKRCRAKKVTRVPSRYISIGRLCNKYARKCGVIHYREQSPVKFLGFTRCVEFANIVRSTRNWDVVTCTQCCRKR